MPENTSLRALLIDFAGTLFLPLSGKQWLTAAARKATAGLSAHDRSRLAALLDSQFHHVRDPGRDLSPTAHRRSMLPALQSLVTDKTLAKAHTDFRNPGNSGQCASLAGEDLAAAVGRHWPSIADIDGLSPYFSPRDTAHAGCRDDDEHFAEATALLGAVLPASQIRHRGADQAARTILDVAGRAGLDGYWSIWTRTSLIRA